MSGSYHDNSPNTRSDSEREAHIVAKITWRLIPFLFLLYIAAYLTRINVGLAALRMNEDLGFDDEIFGFGAGIFFFGYFLFEVPGNLILERTGARLWIGSIAIVWGILSACMMFVSDSYSFYALRFCLGLAQAGFFPGIILYLTYWFPPAHRARAVAKFMTAAAVASIVGGPVSGILLQMNGIGGLTGWQWLFLIEAAPSVLLGIATFFFLTDTPASARWLTDEEKNWLTSQLQTDHRAPAHHGLSAFNSLADVRILLLCLLYLCLAMSVYGLGYWLPRILQQSFDFNDIGIASLTAAPYLLAAVSMVIIAKRSDHTGAHRRHLAWSAFCGSAGFVLAVTSTIPLLQLTGFCVAAIGMWSTLGPFWTLPTAFLTGTAAAAGIALINSVGNLGGFLGPYVMGYISKTQSNPLAGIWVLAGCLLFAGSLAFAVRHRQQ